MIHTNSEHVYPSPVLCWICEQVYTHKSMGGDHICPRCDCGVNVNGSKWTFKEAMKAGERFRLHRERFEQGIDDGNTPLHNIGEDLLHYA